MTYLNKIKDILGWLMILMFLIGFPITTKMPFDKSDAELLIKDSYRPVMTFVGQLEKSEDPMKLKVPSSIRSEEDFVQLLEGKIDDHTAKSIYEDWIIEEEGTLYASSGYFIPTMYEESRIITDAHIKVRQPLVNKYFYNKDANIETELVIKERQEEYITTYYKRTYYYELTESDEWLLDHVNGTSNIGFVEPDHNPWYQ